jgi:hypothetical protein
MRSPGLALLFVSSLLASSASAGFSGHSGGFRFFPSGHFGGFGHHGGFGRFGRGDMHRMFAHRMFEHGRDGGQHVFFLAHRGNFGHIMGFRWHNGAGAFAYFAPQILYFDPATAQETTYPPLTVIPSYGNALDPPAKEVASSGPQVIVIGAEPTRPLPRVIYGTMGVE